MRLFTAIDLPPDVIQRLDVLISHLRAHAHVKWSPAYNLHITTRFIGEWEPSRLSELDAALGRISVSAPVTIDVRGMGWFPNPRNPRVFYAAVNGSPSLHELARATDNCLSGLGLEPEQRTYSPHLTLARIKEPVPLDPLRDAVASLKSDGFGSFTAPAFYLYHSRSGPSGSVYSKLKEFSLPA